MPKRRLTELAKEYNVPFEELLEMVYHKQEGSRKSPLEDEG